MALCSAGRSARTHCTYGVRHGFALPYRTELQRQLPVVCLAAALNEPAGFIQANPLGNGQVVITGSGWSILLPLVWYDASRT